MDKAVKEKLERAYNDLMAYTDWANSGEDFVRELEDPEVGHSISEALDQLNAAHAEYKRLLNDR